MVKEGVLGLDATVALCGEAGEDVFHGAVEDDVIDAMIDHSVKDRDVILARGFRTLLLVLSDELAEDGKDSRQVSDVMRRSFTQVAPIVRHIVQNTVDCMMYDVATDLALVLRPKPHRAALEQTGTRERLVLLPVIALFAEV